MQSQREIKNEEEKRKLGSFCRYLRKNPELFSEHNLHQLMLDDQDKKGGVEKEIKEEKKEIEHKDEVLNGIKEIKEKKEKKPRKKKVKEEKKEEKIEELGPLPLIERQSAQSELLKPEAVQEEKN